MLENVLTSCRFVIEHSKNVSINYNKVEELIKEISVFERHHYLTKVPYDIMSLSTEDVINFLLICDSIIFSFWGNPKWTIKADGQQLDGTIALLYSMLNIFKNKSSHDVFNYFENISKEEFQHILKGNVKIPLFDERYDIIKNVSKIVNQKMNGSFYQTTKNIDNDIELCSFIVNNFPNFIDVRNYNSREIAFYKLAQLLTSDILHVMELKTRKKTDYTHLLGCADYKIPQILRAYDILEYTPELSNLIDNKQEILENSAYEVEIRASVIVVIDYIWKKIDKVISRIEINDFLWQKGQDKSKVYKPYHLTRTTTY